MFATNSGKVFMRICINPAKKQTADRGWTLPDKEQSGNRSSSSTFLIDCYHFRLNSLFQSITTQEGLKHLSRIRTYTVSWEEMKDLISRAKSVKNPFVTGTQDIPCISTETTVLAKLLNT